MIVLQIVLQIVLFSNSSNRTFSKTLLYEASSECYTRRKYDAGSRRVLPCVIEVSINFELQTIGIKHWGFTESQLALVYIV